MKERFNTGGRVVISASVMNQCVNTGGRVAVARHWERPTERTRTGCGIAAASRVLKERTLTISRVPDAG